MLLLFIIVSEQLSPAPPTKIDVLFCATLISENKRYVLFCATLRSERELKLCPSPRRR